MLTFCARIFVLVAVLTAPLTARAADAVFPPGSRIGMVPPEGVKVAAEFLGFESDDKNVKFGFAELPAEAFTSVEAAIKEGKGAGNGLKPEPIKTEAGDAFFTAESKTEAGITVRNYSLIAKGETFTAYVIAQVKDNGKTPPDAEIRKSLSSVVLRKDVPTAEQLDLLPFKVGDIGGFKTVRSLPNRTAVLLSDGDDASTLDSVAYMVIGVVPGRPETPEDRARFAQQAATTIPGLRNARITSNEPIRIDGTPGYETRIEAVTGKSDTPVLVVQWIRFGSQTAMRIVGSSAKDEWPKAFPRFRAVRDSVAAK
jgi:hypothetical protein